LISSEEINQMKNDQSKENHSKRRGGVPLLIAIAIAVLGVLGMLIVDHGSWNKPKVQTAAMAHYSTTGEAARAVGAVVAPTEPKPHWSPMPPGQSPCTRPIRRRIKLPDCYSAPSDPTPGGRHRFSCERGARAYGPAWSWFGRSSSCHRAGNRRCQTSGSLVAVTPYSAPL